MTRILEIHDFKTTLGILPIDTIPFNAIPSIPYGMVIPKNCGSYRINNPPSFQFKQSRQLREQKRLNKNLRCLLKPNGRLPSKNMSIDVISLSRDILSQIIHPILRQKANYRKILLILCTLVSFSFFFFFSSLLGISYR